MAAQFPPDRPNPPDLVPFAEARAAVLERLGPLPVREVGLADALGCVLAAEVAAAEDLPPFANSAMDGFAVRGADLAGAGEATPVALRITGEVFAGTGRLPTVEPGAAARIMTGGALPPGADTIVPVEQTAVEGDTVLVRLDPGPGRFVREAGEDVRGGTVVLERGRVLDPAAVGMLASVGRKAVAVHPRPRVTVVSTGDELVDPGDPLGPGQIRDSNSWLLVAQARAAGAEAFRCGRLRDDPEALRRGFALAAADGDLVLTSGGVSVGDRDYTKRVLAELGDVRSFRVAMQPGMPQAFGLAAGTPLYGLPGNPVSCFVVFETLVRPALRRLAGHPDDRLDRPRVVARLGEPVRQDLVPAGPAVGGRRGPGRRPHRQPGLGGAVLLRRRRRAGGRPGRAPRAPTGLAGPGGAVAGGPGMGELSHLDDQGAARMVDVSAKPETERVATAGCRVVLAPETLELLASAGLPKGDALAVARVAGIMGAKRTPELIPLCHPLPITGVEVDLALEADAVRVTATVRTTGRTGVEMEALTAAATAALTLYDMVKGVQRDVRVEDLRLLAKRGGRSGDYVAT
jgi:molybdopterin molybdotransferase